MLDHPDTESPQDEGDEVPAAPLPEVEGLADRLVTGLGLEIKAAARDTPEAILVDLTGGDRDCLLSRRGEGLGALQYLLNRILYRGRKGKKIQVDCDGFRRLRDEEVVDIARRTAEKVKTQGKESILSPLNPYERRLVHLALAEIGGVETRSIGDGFLKKIVIVPTGPPGAGGGTQDRD